MLSPALPVWQQARIARLEEIPDLVDRIVAAAQDLALNERELFGMRLAVEECLVNAVKHGNRNDPSKCVEARFGLDDGDMIVEIEDQGAGFDPDGVPDPRSPENLERSCGRGLLLMRAYSAWMFHNRRGNCVALGWHASARNELGEQGA
jgi:serine/threonine-protein kinase RsbW